jgi:hypothetical protein
MLAGTHLGRVIAGAIDILYGVAGQYVNVNSVADNAGSSHLDFSLLPRGLELTASLADVVETVAALFSAIGHLGIILVTAGRW